MSVAEYFSSMEYGPAPEDDRAARAWLDQHAGRFGHFINGAWRDSADADRFDSREPATGRALASIAQGTQTDVDAAVEAAHAALEGWQAIAHGAAA
jgi:aldehyde dehydrogenase (NAD+)